MSISTVDMEIIGCTGLEIAMNSCCVHRTKFPCIMLLTLEHSVLFCLLLYQWPFYSIFGRDCLGKCLSHHTWRHLKEVFKRCVDKLES